MLPPAPRIHYGPAIGGVCFSSGASPQRPVDPTPLADSTLSDGPAAPTRRLDLDGATLAWQGLPHHQAARQIATLGSSTLVMDGEIYEDPSAAGNGACSAAGATPAERLLAGWLAHGPSHLAGLEGRFVAAVWDQSAATCTLLNDKFGTKPLYFHRGRKWFAFASRIQALLALPASPRQINKLGLVQFFTFGHLWNRETFAQDIEALDAAAVVRYDGRTGAIERRRYWRPLPGRRTDSVASLTELDQRLHGAVARRMNPRQPTGLALSGGLDARTVLAVADPTAPPTCVCLGMPGSLDQRSSRRLADLAGARYVSVELGADFLADFPRHLQQMTALTDGHYLSQCIVMPTLSTYAALPVEALLRGHAGELLHMHKAYNFSVDDSLAAVRTTADLQEWLFPRLQAHLVAGVDEPVLRGVPSPEFVDLARQSLRTALEDVEHWEHPLDRVSQLFLDQRTRRETAMSLAKFNSVVDLRLPYLDGALVEAVFAAPPELRLGEAIQAEVLRRRRPGFLRPPNSNTGAAVGAGPWQRQFCYYRMRVLAKLGVRGYQPYERLGLWLRRELRGTVEELLLSPRCLDRGVLAADAVRTAVKRHFSGEANCTFLLMAMMILESGLRQFWDLPSESWGGANQESLFSRAGNGKRGM